MEQSIRLSESDQHWVQQNTSQLDNLMKENFFKPTQVFINSLIDFIAETTNAIQGIFYTYQPQNQLIEAIAGYACHHTQLSNQNFELGEGLIGQVFLSKKYLLLDNLPTQYATISLNNLCLSLQALLFFPLTFNDKVRGAIELSYLHNLEPKYLHFLQHIERSLTTMLEHNSNQNELNLFLNETQDQKEQLAIKEEELLMNLEELTTMHDSLKIQSEQTQMAYKRLDQSNKRVLESIEYAKRIQKAFLPSSENLKNNFQDYLILYLPKDLVSGDFYWYHTLEDKKILATIDCTGHGVPGAFCQY